MSSPEAVQAAESFLDALEVAQAEVHAERKKTYDLERQLRACDAAFELALMHLRNCVTGAPGAVEMARSILSEYDSYFQKR